MALVPIEGTAMVPHERVSLEQSLSLWEDTAKLANHLAATEFVPKDLRNKPAAVCAAMLRANELGISPMQGLAQIHVINGRPGLAAELMRALVLSKGHEIWTENFTTTTVTVCGRRIGSDHVEKVTWTMDDAKRANLAGRDPWRAYPRAMLLARATSELCRLVFADVIAGMSYSIEELGDLDEETDFLPDGLPAPVDDDEAAPATQTRKVAGTAKKAAPRKRAAAAKAPAGALTPGPPAPPLPGEPGGAPITSDAKDTDEPDEVVTKRAQMIAMKANDAGVDHHLVIAAITNGEKSSAKAVTAEEGSQVFEALYKIRQGELWLVETDGGAQLVTERPTETSSDEAPALALVQDEPPDNAASGPWEGVEPYELTSEQWRAYLTDRGVKVTKLLAEAQRLAALDGDGEPVPASLDDLAGRDTLCELLFNYVQDLADKAAGE